MTIFSLTDVDLYLGNAELSCVSNNVSVETSVEDLDVTTFCSDGWRSAIGGLKSWTLNAEGFTDYGIESATPDSTLSTDDALFASVAGSGSHNLLVAPLGDASSPVYFGQANATAYSNGGAGGEAAAFSLDASGASSAGLLRGSFLALKDERDGTGVVPQYDHGAAISADARVYVSLHQLNATLTPGDTIKVYSSASVGFSSPVERFSFDAEALGASSSVVSLTGVTHRYWRIEYELTEPATFVAAIAVV